MPAGSLREIRAAVADASRRAVDPIALERDVAVHLQRRVPSDLWCAITMDPYSRAATGGYHAEGLPLQRMPRLLEIENGDDSDVATLRSLAGASSTAVTLDVATNGDPVRSARYRDVLEPSGIRQEVRAVFRDRSGPWGAIVLMRGSGAPSFSTDDVALLEAVSAVVAEGLRRASLLAIAPSSVEDAPGLVLCSVDATVTVDHCTAQARQWLDEIDDDSESGLPYAVLSLVLAVHVRNEPAPGRRIRLRMRSGRWITLHATRLGPSLVSLILEPARPHEVAALLADALRLTSREREVMALAVRGLTNAQIGTALFLSPYTVNDHLKSVFSKVGVTGRTELAAKLYFDHA